MVRKCPIVRRTWQDLISGLYGKPILLASRCLLLLLILMCQYAKGWNISRSRCIVNASNDHPARILGEWLRGGERRRVILHNSWREVSAIGAGRLRLLMRVTCLALPLLDHLSQEALHTVFSGGGIAGLPGAILLWQIRGKFRESIGFAGTNMNSSLSARVRLQIASQDTKN